MFSSMVSSHTLAHRISQAASSLITAPVKGYSGNCPFLKSLSTISSFPTSSETSQAKQSKELDEQQNECCYSLHKSDQTKHQSSFQATDDFGDKSSSYHCSFVQSQTNTAEQQHQNFHSHLGSSAPSQEYQQQIKPNPLASERNATRQAGSAVAALHRDNHGCGEESKRAPLQGAESAAFNQSFHSYSYDSKFKELIEQKKRDETYRVFRRVRRFSASFPHGTEQGRPVTIWCSNDYFGMSSHPKVREAILKALNEFGAGSGGTRNIAGNSPVHEQLEYELADLHDKEAALLFSSCYVANDSTLFTLLRLIPGCQVFSDAGNHASMIQGIRNSGAKKHIFRAFDPVDLEAKLKQVPLAVPKIVAFETVHSMTGDISDVGRMCDVAHKYGAITFVDEVHAVGLYGERGAGIAQRDGCMEKVDIVSGTLGKAYGNFGGYVAASRDLIDVVRSYASGFIFTTSLPPTVACGATESVRILKSEEGRYMRQMQQNNVFHMKRALTAAGLPHYHSKSHIIPIPVGNSAKCTQVMNDLLDMGHYIQSINYPTVPRGSERLRVSVTPFHNEQMVDCLIEKLVSVWKNNELDFLPPVELPTRCKRHELRNQCNAQVGQSVWCDVCHKEMNLCTRNATI